MRTMEKSEKSEHKPLTRRQLKCIALLVGCPTKEEVKRQLKISDQTLHRWLKDPVFKEELSQQQNKVIESALGVLKTNIISAANVLVELLNAEGGELRRRVANDIINHVMKAKELEEIEQRLEQVERAVSESKTR
jgi:hypothetical protein